MRNYMIFFCFVLTPTIASSVPSGLLTDTAGLHFGNLVATTGPTVTYVAYEPRGYGCGNVGGGLLEKACDKDLPALDTVGAVMMEQSNFADFAVKTRVRSRELVVTLTSI
jgi:hypothetical protein